MNNQQSVIPVLPQVGMGCTQLHYSDRSVYTIIEVDPKGKWFICQEDNIEMDKERSDKEWPFIRQRYNYTANPEGRKIKATLRTNGKWVAQGQTISGSMSRVYFILGDRSYYYDYRF